MKRSLPLSIALVTLTPSLAFAHVGHGDLANHLNAFAHPFGGLDHLIAMTLVGIAAAAIGGRALWALPALFMASMAAGIGLGGNSAGIETGVLATLIAMGILVAVGPARSGALLWISMGVAGLFHGAAHGSELAAGGNLAGMAAAALGGTLVLHGMGIALLSMLAPASRKPAIAASGFAAALAGAVLSFV